MNNKLMILVVALSILSLMAIYFLVNPSYEKSIKAKYYFETGEYQQAYILSKEAFALDQYNRMAATVMAQSLTSLKYVKYINMAKGYMLEIDKIANHEYISAADKAKIRVICDIMISSYIKLAPSVITDKKLVEDSAYYYQKFEKLLEKVTK
ncbi:MAG: hypothetical protein H8E76_03465 [Helicobacteraceae bacterium]|nr:hypothetical protein [Candidatus Sulfurimonas ponti]MBL6973604.1 hypothetical protein [Sulfurimonas sp.]